METLQSTYSSLSSTYTAQNPTSLAIYNSASASLPGGNTRTTLFYAPFPLSITHASGSRLFSADGREYIDFLGEYSAGLYGHSHPAIKESIVSTVEKGLNFGSQHADEGKLAGLVKQRFKSIELVRFTNSGTEANLMAICAARAATRRSKVVVFEGAYHGAVLTFKGKDVVVETNVPYEFLVARYNDTASVDAIVAEDRDDIAAVLVEPMLGAGGAIPAKKEFLVHLRKVTNDIGAVLIFDEVMTSRMHRGGGLQEGMGIVPDLTTLGKYVGGGMSFGAFGGKKELMEQFDPRKGKLAHSGTFNNNVLTMAAGRTGLEKIFTPEAATALHQKGEELKQRLNEASKGTALKVTGCGSIMAFHFTETSLEDIVSPDTVRSKDSIYHDIFHLDMLSKGIHIARRGYFAMSLALTESDLDALVEAVKSFVETYRELVKLDI